MKDNVFLILGGDNRSLYIGEYLEKQKTAKPILVEVSEKPKEKKSYTTPLKEKARKEKAIKNDDGKPTHILIEGDNYHALTCLNYTLFSHKLQDKSKNFSYKISQYFLGVYNLVNNPLRIYY